MNRAASILGALCIATLGQLSSGWAAPRLDYSSFLAGSGDDMPTAIVYHNSGGFHPTESVYVGGSSNSEDLAGVGPGGFAPTLHGEQSRCFVSKYSADGKKLHFTTILPVPRPEPGYPLVGSAHLDRTGMLDNGECGITAIAVDLHGAVYVAGVTTMVDSGDANHAAAVPEGTLLGFVQKFEEPAAGSPRPPGLYLVWSRLLGDVHPNSITAINALKVAPGRNEIVVAGNTTSIHYPITTGPLAGGSAYQTSITGGQAGVVTKFDLTGTILRSTYLGVTNSGDSGSQVKLVSLAVDASGAVLVGGSVDNAENVISSRFFPTKGYPVTPNAFVPSNVSLILGTRGMVGYTDAVMTKLSPELSTLSYSTLVAGISICGPTAPSPRINYTSGEDVAIGVNGEMYLAAMTSSECMHTTDTAVQRKIAGQRDALIVKVPANGYLSGTTTPAILYQSYIGFGEMSAVNDCALAVTGTAGLANDSIYLACTVINARRRFLNNLSLDRIQVEDLVGAAVPPVFPSENLLLIRLYTWDGGSRIAYTAGMGGTYAFNLGDIVVDGSTLRFVGSTLSADFPTTDTALDRRGSSNIDGVLGSMHTDLP